MSPAAVVALAGWAAGVAVLAFAVVAKLSDWAQTRARWPVRSALAGPVPVTTVEAAVVVLAVLPVATAPRFGTVAVVYLAYAVAAVRLRGRDCACFGSLASRFTPWHAAGCVAVAALCVLGVAAPDPVTTATVAAVAAAGAGAVAALTARLLRGARLGAASAVDPARIDHVEIYGSDGCPVCAVLWDQQDYYRSFAGCAVTFLKDGPGGSVPGGSGMPAIRRYPAAAAIGPDGSVVHGPVFGLGQIRDLLRATLVQAASERGGEANARLRGAGRAR